MAILGQFRAGKGGRAQFDGTNILMMEYTVKWRTDKLDSSCFENANYEQGLTGLNGLDVSVKGNWNAAQTYNDPPGIFPQDAFPDVNLYPNISDGAAWVIPYLMIVSSDNSATVRGMVTFGVDGVGQPGWTAPVGTAPTLPT